LEKVQNQRGGEKKPACRVLVQKKRGLGGKNCKINSGIIQRRKKRGRRGKKGREEKIRRNREVGGEKAGYQR